ncbi:MAG: helix-turn-helix domain-containing protein [Clostridiales Family XIII bacterium]|nr:helix-turn-helix domain-containing protein [Clostridiales Family XIII bacterium]
MIAINYESPQGIAMGLAGRVKARRLDMDLTQRAFAERAGIPLATYRHFERSGAISLRGLILISVALGMTDDFSGLFSQKLYKNIDEVISAGIVRERKRGSRND